MEALIFDFDGVVIDSEPIHMACFQQVLAAVGIELTRDEYYSKYLGYDDRGCFRAMAKDKGVEISPRQLTGMIEQKTALVQKAFAESVKPLPGAVELIAETAVAGVPVAVCSGALRKEIELACKTVGVLGYFTVIVSAEDVSEGKPSAQGYLLTLRKLSQSLGKAINARRCLVVEDSPAGIESAKMAGMQVLAVTNSYDKSQLAGANAIVESLAGVSVEFLRRIL